jgi:hypothetical protein
MKIDNSPIERVEEFKYLETTLTNQNSILVEIKSRLKLGNACYLLVGRPEGRRPLGRPRRRWEDNIKRDLRKWEGIVGTGWSGLRIGTGGGHL